MRTILGSNSRHVFWTRAEVDRHFKACEKSVYGDTAVIVYKDGKHLASAWRRPVGSECLTRADMDLNYVFGTNLEERATVKRCWEVTLP